MAEWRAMATVARDRLVRRIQAAPLSAPGASPEGNERGTGALLLLLLLGLAGGTVIYYESHHCSPACGPCSTCTGGHCVSNCPQGQVCSSTVPQTCITPVPPPTPCNPACTPPSVCINGTCSSTTPVPCDYTVKSGDILQSIARFAYGADVFPNGAVIWEWLYNQNPQIKTIAEQHGYHSNWWHWIFPGEVIHCPVVVVNGQVFAPRCA